MVQRVRKEVEIHSRLKHPSILEVSTITQLPLIIAAVSEYYRNTNEIGTFHTIINPKKSLTLLKL